jgi:hypothetical protein
MIIFCVLISCNYSVIEVRKIHEDCKIICFGKEKGKRVSRRLIKIGISKLINIFLK